MLKSRMWECPVCSHYFDGLIDDAHRGTGTLCPICEAPCTIENEKITAPNVTRASYVDGRSTDTAKKLKEAARLKSEMYNLRPKDRANHQAEVNKLTKIGPSKVGRGE